jgi:predicted O-methyltransferase YrrM
VTDDFDGLMNGLQGGITAAEGALLRALAAEAAGGAIVEVGSYRGKSAVALALGVRDARGEPATRIYCIEPHREFTGVYGGRFGPRIAMRSIA